jgi:hypothetical protein
MPLAALGAIAALTFAVDRTRLALVVRYGTGAFALFMTASCIAAMFDVAPSLSDVRMGGISWPQAHPGVIPSLACLYLMLGLRAQPTTNERLLSLTAIALSGSLTGWLLVWPFLLGARGLLITAALSAMMLGTGGDLPDKVTYRLWQEVALVLTKYPAAVAMSALLLTFAGVARSLPLAILALYGLRMGSGLWLDPIMLTLVIASLPEAVHAPNTRRAVAPHLLRLADLRVAPSLSAVSIPIPRGGAHGAEGKVK